MLKVRQKALPRRQCQANEVTHLSDWYYYQLAVKLITESMRETAAAGEGDCQQLAVSSANRRILPFEIDFKQAHMASTDLPHTQPSMITSE